MTNRLRRSGLRRPAFAVLLGGAVNIVVAGVCVWMVSIPAERLGAPGYLEHGGRRFMVWLHRTPGKTMYVWAPEPEAGFGLVSGIGIAATPPSWVDMDVDLLTPDNLAGVLSLGFSSPTRCEIAYGWPRLSFRGGVLLLPWKRPGERHDYRPALPPLPGTAAVGVGPEPRTLPLTPMWSGLVANTAIYAAAWWGLLFVPGAWRRWRRRRRGACEACGYDRRGIDAGAPCPECGLHEVARARAR